MIKLLILEDNPEVRYGIYDYLKQFVAALKTSNDKILTMILSDQLEDNDKKCLFQSDIDDYVNKPTDMMELQFRIEHLLKKKE